MTHAHENPTVWALNSLCVLDAHQGAAYREHSAAARQILGGDLRTRSAQLVQQWTAGRADGVLVLTGNAGTGKTALAEEFCTAARCPTPTADGLVEHGGVLVCKDLSGVVASHRADIVGRAEAIAAGGPGLMLLCANEGVLRPLSQNAAVLAEPVDDALLGVLGRTEGDRVLVVNMNRQKWTGEDMWPRLLDYAVAEPKWEACEGCPAFGNCPVRRNAEQLRAAHVREPVRQVVRLAASQEVAPLREVLSVLAYSVTGLSTCAEVIDRNDRRGAEGFTAAEGYFHLLLGGGLPQEKVDGVPVLRALRATGIGRAADLQADSWLREASQAASPAEVRRVGGVGNSDVLSRVQVGDRTLTFGEVGDLISIDPDPRAVDEALLDLLGRNGRSGYLELWRRRLFFEAAESLGGVGPALGRLSYIETFADMLEAVAALEDGAEPSALRNDLVLGLNYLGCGMSSVGGYLHLPDAGITAARDLGSLLPAPPLVVTGSLPIEKVRVRRRAFRDADMLDSDDIDLVLAAETEKGVVELVLSPAIFDMLVLAARYRTPPGPDSPDLAAVELFFSKLSKSVPGLEKMHIADGGALRTVTAPNMEAALDGRL